MTGPVARGGPDRRVRDEMRRFRFRDEFQQAETGAMKKPMRPTMIGSARSGMAHR
ncbi:hypothetical protein GA0071312_0954 [Saliniramus fredricksonii]|uniref:Uncharacterized protein n=1 Tax=Saliniramus fredricksonii TaxID=1653334 RepID=A0ABY0K6I2_9HYPH|nr:hypothetical protein GA0071312_0954 [Saliniramus fredricksonii]